MRVKDIIDLDFVNYKKPSMFIGFPTCTFKCDKECGQAVCQNSSLAAAPTIEISNEEIIKRYINNPITEAIVCGGLEPFDDFSEIYSFIMDFRDYSEDDIVIYTGYYPKEISSYLKKLAVFKNIIIKFGRFIPNKPHKFDDILGVELASDNQFAKRLEDINDV